MDRPDERYTKQQIAHMLEAAKMRGFPVEHMTWRNFINYLKQKAPDIIRYALFNPRPSLAVCHADTTQASLSFGEYCIKNVIVYTQGQGVLYAKLSKM